MPLHFMRRREFITLLGGAAMPMTKEKMSPLNGNGHQNLIAQPGTACQIEFRLIHFVMAKYPSGHARVTWVTDQT